MLALVFLTFLASANALFTPLARTPYTHRALAARVAVPEPVAAAVPIVDVKPLRKRQSGRCSRPAASSPAPGNDTTSAVNATPSPQSSQPAANAAPAPPTEPSQPAVSAAPAPAPESSQPATTTAPAPASTSEQPAANAAPTPGSGSGATSSGSVSITLPAGGVDGTFYATGLGSCGFTNTDSDFICAISKIDYDRFTVGGNPNNNALCGKSLTATYNGKSVTVKIVDRCEACGQGALDFSPAAFDEMADPAIGRMHGMTWVFD